MPEFRYTVVNTQGQTLTGSIEAENEDICRGIIAQRGLFCLNVSPASLASRSINLGGKAHMKAKELSVFCRQFSSMLNSGIGIIKCLDILHEQCDKPKTKAIIKRVYEGVQRGQSLSTSFSGQNGFFPDLMINMVEAGEASGTLDNVMSRIADIFEKNLKTKNKVKSAMSYPLILAILIVLVMTVIMIFVVPVFTKMFQSAGAPLPLPTKIVVAISSSLTSYWYIYLIVLCSLLFAVSSYLKTTEGRFRWDKLITTMPVVGKLNVTVVSARFARTLSTMMQSGIPLLKGLEITSNVIGNKFYEKAISDVREDIKKGVPLSAAMKKTGIFPMMLLSMIAIGEESGTLDEVLNKTAAFYDEESDTAVAKLVGLLEPLMIVIMAVVVLFVVVSIMLPMYGMMTIVK